MKDFKLDSVAGIKSGFKAPDAYFDNLEDKLVARLPQREAKVVPLYRRRPVWVTSAAAVVVVSLSLLLEKKDTAKVAMPDSIAMENYLIEEAGLSAYDLQQNLDRQDISELRVESAPISDKALEEYLSDQNINLYE